MIQFEIPIEYVIAAYMVFHALVLMFRAPAERSPEEYIIAACGLAFVVFVAIYVLFFWLQR